MSRLYIRTFLFESRNHHAAEHAHDAPSVMTVPLVLLASLTLLTGFVVFEGVGKALGFPGGFGQFVWFEEPEKFDFDVVIALTSTVLAGGGVVVGWIFWQGNAEPAKRMGDMFRPVYRLLFNRFYIDEIYQWVINNIVLVLGRILAWFDRNIVNDTGVDGSAVMGYLAGFELKFLETGKLPNYALAIAAGVVIISIVFLLVTV
jgi:NADH-quinone oxidoreductase subunit L